MMSKSAEKKEVKDKKKTGSKSGHSGKPKNRRRSRRKRSRRDQDLQHRVVDIRRVTRVIAGGRRFGFSVILIAGDKKGSVGVGVGKAGDVAQAIGKALNNAKKNMIYVQRTKEGSILHDVEVKYSSSRVALFAVPGRTGITAGGPVRTVLEFAGIEGVSAKLLSRTKNAINNSRATIKALMQLPGTEKRPYAEKGGGRSGTQKKGRGKKKNNTKKESKK